MICIALSQPCDGNEWCGDEKVRGASAIYVVCLFDVLATNISVDPSTVLGFLAWRALYQLNTVGGWNCQDDINAHYMYTGDEGVVCVLVYELAPCAHVNSRRSMQRCIRANRWS